MHYYARTLTKIVRNASNDFPAILITGPRQVGKTTLFEHCKEQGRAYVTLDDPAERALAQEDPALFLETHPAPVLIDEVQNAPQLFPHIKMAVDRRKKMGMFWLTGSQAFAMMERVTESLAGRVAVLELQGLSQSEKRAAPDQSPFLPDARVGANAPEASQEAIYKAVFKGSYPALFSQKEEGIQIFYSSYVKTYLERDVRKILNITQESAFLKFLSVAAARTGQLLNYTDMAKDCGVSQPTVQSWVSALETSRLVYLLRPYFNNRTSRAIKTPKLYFFDTGLACYLAKFADAESVQEGIMSGALLENYVISEIWKSYLHNGMECPAYFYRDKDGREIDLILERDRTLYPIDVKRTASPCADDAKHFKAIDGIVGMKVGMGAILCLRKTPLPINRTVMAIPISHI